MTSRGRFGGLVAAVAVAVLLAASAGNAATPSQIYKDYADNGRLDQPYTDKELQRALKDALVQGYGQPSAVSGLGNEVGGAAQGVQSAGGGLPFTGLDLTLMVAVGLALVLFGATLRRTARRKT